MLFNFFITALPAIAIGTKLVNDREAFADYLMTQIEEGRLSDRKIIELAQAYDDEHEGSFGDYTVFNQIDSDVLDEIFAQDDGEPLSVAETEASLDDLPKPDVKAQTSSELPFLLAPAIVAGHHALVGAGAHTAAQVAAHAAAGAHAGAHAATAAHTAAGAHAATAAHTATAAHGGGGAFVETAKAAMEGAAGYVGGAMKQALTSYLSGDEENEAKLSGIICGTCAATIAAAKEEKENEEKKEFVKGLLEKGKEWWAHPPWAKEETIEDLGLLKRSS